MSQESDFTKGPITGPLLKFALPVLLALILQALYGTVDLLIVGRFAESCDVSAVATGSQIMMTVTHIICALSVGTTIYLGQTLGAGDPQKGGRIVGASLGLFLLLSAVITVLVPLFDQELASLMNAPAEAFDLTADYIFICGLGSGVIIFYNLIGSIFRGLGDSKTPLITVVIACVCNIIGDLLLVAVFSLGTRGAAWATVGAQAVSVWLSVCIIKRQKLPFEFSWQGLNFERAIVIRLLSLGVPVALQSFLVGLSFLIILAIVNNLGLIPSAGVGVAEKICEFVMLFPSAFAQSMSAFVAHNIGAGRYDRACLALRSAISAALCLSLIMFVMGFWHGDLLARLFTPEALVISAAADYLKAYAIDCLLTSFLFCFIGFFNGLGYTKFVMIQGIIGAFAVRVPVSYYMSLREPVSLFQIGLATPCSTIVQIVLCFACLVYANRHFGQADAVRSVAG
ncbi:MAG: MATE family efflux transporter [bacterium]|nr:MATE family efflux transporter [bacterium]